VVTPPLFESIFAFKNTPPKSFQIYPVLLDEFEGKNSFQMTSYKGFELQINKEKLIYFSNVPMVFIFNLNSISSQKIDFNFLQVDN